MLQIQSWWRGTMVTEGLGPFGTGNKKGKKGKKGKDSAKGKKKKGK